jgi:hypothetical protein
MLRGVGNALIPGFKAKRLAKAAAAVEAAAQAARAAADAQGVAAFAAEGDAGKLLRVTYKFDAVVAQARAVLINYDYVTIPFPVGAGGDLDAGPAIAAYVRDGTLPAATSEASAIAAANAVTKENLLDVLLRMAQVRDLKTALEAVVFDTRAGDARGPPYAAGTGKFNLSAGATPYAGAGGDARFRALLRCFYGERLVQPCVRDNQTVYAHMKLVDELTPDCKTALITAIIGDFPPGDELCAALAEAADAQAPAGAAAAGAGGGGGAGPGPVDLGPLRAAVLAAQQDEAAAQAAGDAAAEAAAHARFEAAEEALRLAQVHVGGARRYRQRPRHSRRKGRSQQGRGSRSSRRQ